MNKWLVDVNEPVFQVGMRPSAFESWQYIERVEAVADLPLSPGRPLAIVYYTAGRLSDELTAWVRKVMHNGSCVRLVLQTEMASVLENLAFQLSLQMPIDSNVFVRVNRTAPDGWIELVGAPRVLPKPAAPVAEPSAEPSATVVTDSVPSAMAIETDFDTPVFVPMTHLGVPVKLTAADLDY